jgi:general secretion pathway protein N
VRVDDVPPRTWLLAVVAGWGLVLWTLTLAGLGGRVQRLPDDPALLANLPQLAPASPERLGPLSQYAETGTRPLFSEDRRPQPFSLVAEGDENAPPAFDFVLTSVLLTPTLRMAIVQPSAGGESVRIKLGDAAESQPAWRLTELNPRSAIFQGPDGEKTLDLRVFDGSGGEPPTAMAGANNKGNNAQQPMSPRPANRPQAQPPVIPQAAPEPAPAPVPDATDEPPSPEAQVESIRKRIEERRAQLRQEAQPPAAPVKNP